MNKTEAIDRVATAAGLPKDQAKRAIDALLDLVRTQLSADREVSFLGFGAFKTARREAYQGRNPINGSAIEVPAKNIVKFVPAKPLREAVNPERLVPRQPQRKRA